VLDSQSTVPDNPHGKDIGRAKGDVEFDDINFSYDGKRPALVHFSLDVPAGTTVAFVGPTGAGKSTALSLLHRMWDAQCHPGRARGGRAARRGARLHHAPVQRLRNDGG
jgi:ATP-binding cassette, subfamily B, beta-glucan exporter